MNPEDMGGALAGLLAGGVMVFLIMMLIAVAVPIIAYWKIISKTGHPGPIALLMLLPLVNIIIIYWLALAEWPALRMAQGGAGMQPAGYPPPPAYPPPPSGYPPPPQAYPPPPPQMPPQQAPATPAFCRNCGSVMNAGSQFCGACGWKAS